MELPIIEQHRDKLKAAYDATSNEDREKAWRPFNARRWAEQVKIGTIPFLPEESLGRTALAARLAKIGDAVAATALVLAWGGMNRTHGQLLFEKQDMWLPVVRLLRAGSYSRTEAYAAFAELRAGQCLPGMGAPYFTKLIFFLGRDSLGQRGYIMDQWTACSINLLFEHDIVDLAPRTFWVTDRNAQDRYERFNQAVEHLAHLWNAKPEDIETAMFDRGGRRPGAWRAYVKNWRRPYYGAQPIDRR